jgi:hypothetical protein
MNDSISGIARLITSSFGSNFPLRVGVGIGIATLLKIIIHVLAVSTPPAAALNALDEFALYWYIVAISPLMFVPIIFNRHGIPEHILFQLNVVDAVIIRGKFTAAQRTLLYQAIANRYVHALHPTLEKPPDLEKIFEEIRKDLGVGTPTPG